MGGVQTSVYHPPVCAICMEIYSDPATLTCGHTLCSHCLTSFLLTRPDSVLAFTLPCPFCRRENPVPDPTKPPEEWASQMTPSREVRRQLEAFHRRVGYRRNKDENPVKTNDTTRSHHEIEEFGLYVTSSTVSRITNQNPPITQRRRATVSVTLSPVFHHAIDVRHRDDDVTPQVVGITVIHHEGVRTLVVADAANACLKSIKDGGVTSRLNVPDGVLGIVKLSGNIIAATLFTWCIAIIEVKPALHLLSKMKTNCQYRGITALSRKRLAVGTWSSPSVDIIDLRGNILNTISHENTGLVFQWPDFFCTSHDENIIMTDTAAVYCVTPEGETVFIYAPRTRDKALRAPRGTAVTKTGDILVADRLAKRVIQLNPNGEFVSDILTSSDNLKEPGCLYVDDNNKLYVCDEGSVKIYYTDMQSI